MDAGAAGDISVAGAVGDLGAGDITITNAFDVTFDSTVAAGAFTQFAGAGTTLFSGLIDLDANFEFTGENLTISGVGINEVGGLMTVTNAGTFTLSEGADLQVAGGLTQNGLGPNAIGADISTTNSTITFGSAVTISNNPAFDTGVGAGNIIFESTLDGNSNLGLDAGTGDIEFRAVVGGVTPLGDVLISDVRNLDIGSVFTAGSLGSCRSAPVQPLLMGQSLPRPVMSV